MLEQFEKEMLYKHHILGIMPITGEYTSKLIQLNNSEEGKEFVRHLYDFSKMFPNDSMKSLFIQIQVRMDANETHRSEINEDFRREYNEDW